MDISEDKMAEQLKALTAIPGPVGREALVQSFMEEQFRNYTSEILWDRVGNLTAHFPGEGVKTVVAAHACEIGFIVKSVTEDGFLKIAPNYKTRGADTRILPFHDVTILTDTYELKNGFLTIDTGHITDPETRKKAPLLEDVCVDVGCISAAEVKSLGIEVGCPMVWDVRTRGIRNRMKGKAMDDRLGLVTLLYLAEFFSWKKARRDLWLASTVQEEIGVRGARALASQHSFDEAYIVEITPTSISDRTVQLGEGPVIVYKDGSMHYSHELILKCKSTAEENGIFYQTALLERGITDGLGFFVHSASKTALLGCSTLYPHSPGETIDVRDLHQLGNLLQHILE